MAPPIRKHRCVALTLGAALGCASTAAFAGAADILWRNTETGANVIWVGGNYATTRNAIWYAGNATFAVALPAVPKHSWRVVGIGDFDNNGTDDVLWRDGATGNNVVWPSANAASAIGLASVSNQAWTVAAVGDFDDPSAWDY